MALVPVLRAAPGPARRVISTRLASTGGGESKPRQLTTTSKSDRHPRWSPNGKQVLFESNRSGDNQLWVIDVGTVIRLRTGERDADAV